MKLEFQVHRQVLTNAVLNTIRNHVEIHGGQFRPEALKQMSVPLEESIGEALMFGADYWPVDMKAEPEAQAEVVRLFSAANPMAPSPFRIKLRRAAFWLRLQFVRLLMWGMKCWAMALFMTKPTGFVKTSAAANALFLTFAA